MGSKKLSRTQASDLDHVLRGTLNNAEHVLVVQIYYLKNGGTRSWSTFCTSREHKARSEYIFLLEDQKTEILNNTHYLDQVIFNTFFNK